MRSLLYNFLSMGKIITTIVIVLLVIWGLYYVVDNKINKPAATYATSSVSTPSATQGTDTRTGAEGTTSTPANTTVEITNFAFSPKSLTVKKGTTVTWVNRDSSPHNVTSVTGNVLKSQTLSTGQSFSYSFNEVGTVQYYCTIHPNMRATVIVIE